MNELDGAKYYEGQDKSIGIILFHAYTGSPNDVNLLARKLNRLGYGVLCPVFKGHGTANVNEILDESIETWKKIAVNAVLSMKEEYDDVMIFGLSLGGIFATWLSTQVELNIRAGGVFNSPVYTEDPIDVEVHFIRYVKAIYKRFLSEEAYEEDIDSILSKHHSQMKELEAFKKTFVNDLDQITQPFFIAQSGKEEMIESQDALKLREALVNSKVDFHWFPNNTHVITVNRDREDFEQALIHFIHSNK
ncbi:alpha/beta hydrolase [Aerococcaceae bacterium WGS1372]